MLFAACGTAAPSVKGRSVGKAANGPGLYVAKYLVMRPPAAYNNRVGSVPVRPKSSEPVALHAHAMDNLRFIRETMESAGSFTAVPGMGGILMGFSALAAAVMADRQAGVDGWLAVWVGEAFVAVLIGVAAAAQKARAGKAALLTGPGRKFALGLAPSIFVAALLTIVLYRAGLYAVIPGIWLLLYGTGILSGGAFSVPVVPVMGICFVALGAITVFCPLAWSHWLLAAGVGGLLLVLGGIISRRYGA